MKAFDSTSISSRLKTTLSSSPEWSSVLGDSAITSLLDSISESEAEDIRYVENLLAESKWKYAQNLSSLVTQCNYLGYLPQKKISALGNVVVSHDPALMALGSTIFDETDLLNTLTKYSGNNISIPQGTIFTPSIGVTTQLISSATTGNTYIKDMQYLLIPVIQGKMTSVAVTVLGNAFETIAISDPLLEDASNIISTRFFAVTAKLPNVSESIPITRYDDIFLADSLEYAYDISVSVDLTLTKIRFGDGTTGRLLPNGTLITITYLQSLGASGNITSQYIVNNIGSTLIGTLYASNLSPIIGGENSDTAEDIRNKAPQSYLSRGKSIVSAQEYRAAMLTLPYIYNANVYSGLYLDPLSNSLQSTIYYTAIDLLGYDAITTTSFVTDLPLVLEDRTSPLDILTYISPNFLHMRYNMRGILSNTSSTDIGTLTTALTSELYTNFGTIAQNFFIPFNSKSIDKYITHKYTDVSLDAVMIEAVSTLPASSFIPDSTYTDYYKKTFSFDKVFAPFYGFDNKHQYCLKINIIFTCVNCLTLSRTLFLVPDTANTTFFSCDIANVETVTRGYINFCGRDLSITIPDIINNYTIMKAVYNAIFTDTSFNTSYNYEMTNAGYLSVSTKLGVSGSGAALSTLVNTIGNIAVGGVVFKTVPTGTTRILQYPYISEITDNDTVIDNIFSNIKYAVIPETISGVANPEYIPIKVDFDYSSLVPTVISDSQLGFGTLHIPLYMSDGTGSYYLNFALPQADENVLIEVVAQPVSSNFIPILQNSIIQMKTTVQNALTTAVTVEDINISLTNE